MQDFTQVKIRFKDLRSQNAMHEVKFCSVRCKDIRTDDFQRKVKFSSMVFCFVSDVCRAYGDVSGAVKIPFSRILQPHTYPQPPQKNQNRMSPYHIGPAGLCSSVVHFCS